MIIPLTKSKVLTEWFVVPFFQSSSTCLRPHCLWHMNLLYGGTVYILKLEKDDLIDGEFNPNAHSRLLEKVELNVASEVFENFYPTFKKPI